MGVINTLLAFRILAIPLLPHAGRMRLPLRLPSSRILSDWLLKQHLPILPRTLQTLKAAATATMGPRLLWLQWATSGTPPPFPISHSQFSLFYLHPLGSHPCSATVRTCLPVKARPWRRM